MFFEHTVMELLDVVHLLEAVQFGLGCRNDFIQLITLELELVDRLVRDVMTGEHAHHEIEFGIGDSIR